MLHWGQKWHRVFLERNCELVQLIQGDAAGTTSQDALSCQLARDESFLSSAEALANGENEMAKVGNGLLEQSSSQGERQMDWSWLELEDAALRGLASVGL